LIQGQSPFTDISELAAGLGATFDPGLESHVAEEAIAYRTPGALVLMAPLLIVSWEDSRWLFAFAGLSAFLLMILWSIPRFCNRGIENMIVPLAFCCVAMPVQHAAASGSVSSVIAAVVVPFLSNPTSTGGALGAAAATTLKVFPGMALLPLVGRSATRKALLVAISSALVLHLVGVIVFGVDFRDTIRLLWEGPRAWLGAHANISISAWAARYAGAAWLAPAVTVGAIFATILVARAWPLRKGVAVALVVSMMVSPVSWIHYDLLLIPLVMRMLSEPLRKTRFALWAATFWIGASIASYGLVYLDQPDVVLWLAVFARLGILAALAWSPDSLWEGPGRRQST
jgi:alpha-1,2-mannosyltransferase